MTRTRRDATRSERLRYWFDDYMSRGSRSTLTALLLTFISAFLVIGMTRVVAVFLLGDAPVERGDSGWRQVYVTFLELTDPGSMTQDVESSPWVKVFAVVSGLVGLILLSSLIALLTTAIDGRLEQLRKGHSKVVLDGHTLILGWNDRVLDVLRELVLANESEDEPAVVILADEPKEVMDDYLALNIPDSMNTKIVTRSGSPSALVNLEVVAVRSCKSVVVLAGCNVGAREEEKARADLDSIKSLLAVVSRLGENHGLPIIAEIFGESERTLARAIDANGVICIEAEEALAKIIVQTSRSSGLAVVYEEMLSFDGAELYFFKPPGGWDGSSFQDALFRFPDGVAIGIRRGDEININPPRDVLLQDNEELLILASDDSAIEFRGAPVAVGHSHRPADTHLEQHVERQLVIGFSPKLSTLAREYADYVLDGSEIDVVLREPSDEVRQRIQELDAELPTMDIKVVSDDAMSSEVLLALRPFEYDNIIILSQSSGDEAGEDWTDSETLVILLQLQWIFRDRPKESATKLIAEILDSRNRDLVAQTGVREFIISNSLISMMVAQLSEDPFMARVYDDLFAEDGSEIYLKDAGLYFDLPVRVTFADVIATALDRDEVAIGLKDARREHLADENFGVTLIPAKDTVFELREGDTIVVVSEDET